MLAVLLISGWLRRFLPLLHRFALRESPVSLALLARLPSSGVLLLLACFLYMLASIGGFILSTAGALLASFAALCFVLGISVRLLALIRLLAL